MTDKQKVWMIAGATCGLRCAITEQGKPPYEAVVQATLDRFGTLNVLVSNAGHG